MKNFILKPKIQNSHTKSISKFRKHAMPRHAQLHLRIFLATSRCTTFVHEPDKKKLNRNKSGIAWNSNDIYASTSERAPGAGRRKCTCTCACPVHKNALCERRKTVHVCMHHLWRRLSALCTHARMRHQPYRILISLIFNSRRITRFIK